VTAHLLLIDDCRNISVLLNAIVERFCHMDLRLSVAHDLAAGLETIQRDPPDAILLDYNLRPDLDCCDSISAIEATGFDGPVHLWSSLDRYTLGKDPAIQRATNFFHKQDYVGMGLRKLVLEIFCQGCTGCQSTISPLYDTRPLVQAL